MTFEASVFALRSSAELGERVAAALGVALAPHEERPFDGGEHKARPLVSVRGRDTFVLASLDGDAEQSANDKLCRVLFFVATLKQAAARSVTVVAPYLCYSRKDRQTKARDPVTTRYVAQLFEAVGTDRLMTVEAHNLAAFQNASRGPTEHLEATEVFVRHIRDRVRPAASGRRLVVVSPDLGGAKRAKRLRDRLAAELGDDVGFAFADKERSRGVLSGREEVFGEVAGTVAIVYDDLISSGGTMRRVADVLAGRGAHAVHLIATHGLFTPAAASLFTNPSVASVVVSDSVAPRHDHPKLVIAPIGGLLAQAIDRAQRGGSLSDLLHLDV